MAGGKRFKFHGSTIGVLAAYAAAKAITGITNANPVVITSAAHGNVAGDLVKIEGIVGMTELNDELYVVGTVTDDTFTLLGVDSTSYGTYTSGGTAKKGTFSNFCELTGYDRQGGSKTENDATSLCSEARESELGLADFGTTKLDFFFAPRTAIQTALKSLDLSGEKTAVRVILPKAGGHMTQLGYVQQMSEQSSTGGLWTGSATIRNTGSRIDLAA